MAKKWRICIVLVLVVALAAFTGCNLEKTAITPEEFQVAAVEAGFALVDDTESFGEQVKSVYIAVPPHEAYQIEYFLFASDQQGVAAVAENKAIFESMKGAVSTTAHVDGKNYNMYKMNSNGQFMHVCRVDDTMVYVTAPDSYQKEIEEVLSKLGY